MFRMTREIEGRGNSVAQITYVQNYERGEKKNRREKNKLPNQPRKKEEEEDRDQGVGKK